MIQELFGGGSAPTGLLGERRISNPFSSPSSQSCPTSTPILTTTSIATTASSASLANPPNSSNAANNNNNNNNSSNNNSNNNSESNPSQQNLRCPRCDSTNTKFCYYNNYNLTQPRHFCKTCRRYWTKGGTLRNVPIGGGCRKNKSTTASAASATSGFTKSSSNAMAKAKATLSTELLVNGNPGYLGTGLLDHLHHHPELQQGVSNPILWPSLQQNSHILSLLRGSNQFHNHNPNPSPNPMSNVFTAVKTEGNNTAATNLGLDSYGNGAPSLLGSYPRSNQQQQANGFSSGVQDYAQNNGNSSNIIELYQRLKSSSNYNNYCGNENQGTVIFGNMMGSSSSSPSSPMHSNILDSAPVGGGDNYGGYSFMSSPAISGWSDYPTVPINGAYP